MVEAFTYYAHREKLTVIGREQGVERLNRDALAIASEVADESGALLAGNVCNTNIWDPDSPGTRNAARAMFEEQVGWAVDAGVDFIIGETFEWVGEAMAALETIKAAGKHAVMTFSIVPHGTLFDADPVEGCRRLADAGADVVGFNCSYGPMTMLPLVERVRESVSCHVAALPVPYRTTDEHPSFFSFRNPDRPDLPDGNPFPTALDSYACDRHEMAGFARKAYNMGTRYIGVCCGAGPHHIRSIAEMLGRTPPASRYSPDMSKHASLGTDPIVTEAFRRYAD